MTSYGSCKEREHGFRIGAKILPTTKIFETYWRFAVERQEIFFKRMASGQAPWTLDPILRQYKFTNVYRASDRVSQFLIRNVIYKGDQTPQELFFRTILFKLFNRIDTWSLLEDRVGCISWRDFDLDHYDSILGAHLQKGQRLYSAAYIMPCPPFGALRKHTNHLMLLAKMMRDHIPDKIACAKSLQSVFAVLRSYPSLGDFLAFQFTIDLNYSMLLDFSEMDFVVAGPGARSGIKKVFADTCGFTHEDVIRAMAEDSTHQFERHGLTFRDLWGRPLQLIDCQNLFCEVDKYSRVAHPESNGEGRERIKQRYRSGLPSISTCYPPKWGLRPDVSGSPNHPQSDERQYLLFNDGLLES